MLRLSVLAVCIFQFSLLSAQLNTDRITAIGRNALYFEDYVLSIQYFNQVIKLKPYLSEPYQLRAIAKIQLSDYQGALRDCNAAIERNPFQPGAYYTRGYVYRQLGEFDKAEKDFSEALIFSPENKTYMLLRADTRSQQGRYDEARADIDYLLRREPESASLHFERGVICMQQQDTTCALAEFASTVQYDSQNAQNWSAYGVVTMMTGDDDAAFAHITKAINLGSKYAGDYINRGIIYYRKHNYRAALTDYDKAIELSPRESQCYFNRGVLRQEVGDYNRAYDDLSKALELIALSPSATSSSDLLGPILYQRGMVSMQLQQWKDAIVDFDSLSRLHPTFLPSYYIASRAHTALGQKKKAQACLQRAYKIEHDHNSGRDTLNTSSPLNTNAQMARTEQGRRDYRKLFSQRAAQNGEADTQEQKYSSASRGRVQDRYQDLINEPGITLTYYAQSAGKYNYSLATFNRLNLLPDALRATTHELPLSAEMVSHHFSQITNLSATIDALPPDLRSVPEQEGLRVAMLLFSRAIEFAIVQDYASAIEDCSRALTLSGLDKTVEAIMFFCQANWRYRLLEYQRATGDESLTNAETVQQQRGLFTLMLMDYDQVIRRLPDFAFAYYNKANILCRQKDFEAAIRHYDDAIRVDSEFAEAYFNRGLTYIYIGKQKEGLQDLSRAGELGIYQAYNIITRLQ
ncbi:MAG: tetratricopeptide repeat protein [Paludibacteraceae bacterium]|nr:tetratricopeptide repeat protein [Paludibacteraceae bacterium]